MIRTQSQFEKVVDAIMWAFAVACFIIGLSMALRMCFGGARLPASDAPAVAGLLFTLFATPIVGSMFVHRGRWRVGGALFATPLLVIVCVACTPAEQAQAKTAIAEGNADLAKVCKAYDENQAAIALVLGATAPPDAGPGKR